jgi:cephalosporin-C deacetylase-like acetyl esterase
MDIHVITPENFKTPSEVTYRLSANGECTLEKGTLHLKKGEGRLSGTLDHPGFLRCDITVTVGKDTLHAACGCGFNVEEIRPAGRLPENFDRFWREAMAELLRIPIDPQIEEVDVVDPGDAQRFKVRLASVNGSRVYGWLHLPEGDGPFPTVLSIPGSGIGRTGRFAGFTAAGIAVLAIEIHGLEPQKHEIIGAVQWMRPTDDEIDGFVELQEGILDGYHSFGIEDPYRYYHRRSLQSAMRAIDYLYTRTDIDTSQIFVFGGSQGGGLSLLTAAIDKRIKAVVATVPAFCNNATGKYGHMPQAIRTMTYYDAALAAELIKVPTMIGVGFIDKTCSPTSVYSAYNNLKGVKKIENFYTYGHGAPPDWREKTIKWILEESGILVRFPGISKPVPITTGPEEHLFASYYGINSWSANQKYATVLETNVKFRIPTENDTATLGLVDMETHEFIPIATTRAWNFQQGCMAHWLTTSPDSLIIYNDYIEGKFVSVILNVFTRAERIIPYPVSAVSPNGKEAISINFSRLRITRPDYGYGGDGQDSKKETPFPADDGLFLVNLETVKATLLVSLEQVEPQVPPTVENLIEYFNHTLFSRDGSKIFWLARGQKYRNTTAFTINRDGTNLLRCFPDEWGGSHFDWLDGNNLMITAKYDGNVMGHILFTVGNDNYERLGKGLLDYDGHGTFSPDGNWMITDTYPDRVSHEQKLYLMDMKNQAVLALGRFVEPPEFTSGWRCDLHPRWSPDGDMFGFNSTFTGSRQVYVIKFE